LAQSRRAVMTDIILSPVVNTFRITDGFGANRGSYAHLGTDFGAVTPGVAGDPLVAVADGTLDYQYRSGSFGLTSVLEIDNGDGSYSYFIYAHQSGYAVKLTPEHPQAEVYAGQTIGYMAIRELQRRGTRSRFTSISSRSIRTVRSTFLKDGRLTLISPVASARPRRPPRTSVRC
jgi:murein DD-endopeptidase MepM/ murein hydrolase activator NlpD